MTRDEWGVGRKLKIESGKQKAESRKLKAESRKLRSEKCVEWNITALGANAQMPGLMLLTIKRKIADLTTMHHQPLGEWWLLNRYAPLSEWQAQAIAGLFEMVSLPVLLKCTQFREEPVFYDY